MLGTLTMPNIFSVASPALSWAWLRYFLVPSSEEDLRVILPFADLDPHQKGILSDDFGVAISTQWLHDCLGGFVEIIDGRRFMLQFADLIHRPKRSTAKVGPGKAPDFVIKDTSGKWHVLECKCTQSGRANRNKFLRTAITQKHVIQIKGSLQGERLAAGLALSNEEDKLPTQLRIIDPENEPTISLGPERSDEIDISAKRLSLARALSLVGLNAPAADLSLPENASQAFEFLRPSEISRTKMSREARNRQSILQLRNRDLQKFVILGTKFEGRVFRMTIPQLRADALFNVITVRQVINSEFLNELASSEYDFISTVDRRLPFTLKTPIKFSSEGGYCSLSYGSFLFADVQLTKE